MEKDYIEKRIHIAEWPDLERKMGVIARMTSDPPLRQTNEEIDTISLQSKREDHKEREFSAR